MLEGEALLRWEHPLYGFIKPEEVIQIAEESDMIFLIDKWIVHEVCRFIAELTSKDIQPVNICINMSNKQFHHISMYSHIREAVNHYNVPPGLLVAELTENMISTNIEYCQNIMSNLKDLGIMISIDDFGTGYLSLSFIKQYPIDQLKMDKSFIDDIEKGKTDEAIVSAIIALANELNVDIFAKGVETVYQLESLLTLKCHLVQGYLYSRPVQKDRFIHMLRSKSLTPFKHQLNLHQG